ncbi:ribonuclease HII [bacterium BMS3Abin05]|nr:ribonuclease HII [bacterium BMS3Abin05]GBE27072.1 ribonuclease HII [bacterium BMS3Bbin03]
MQQSSDLLQFENQLWAEAIRWLAGVDEAGRGPLAGPVVAAAVVFEPYDFIEGVKDSKALSASHREELYHQIVEKAAGVGIGMIGPVEIDHINILQATLTAMKMAVDQLPVAPDYVLVDGRDLPDWEYTSRAIIRGDLQSFSIAAASIVAKVYRDRLMIRYDRLYPAYHFAQNKGYGTRQHILALQQFGPSEIHRKSFHWKPCEKH